MSERPEVGDLLYRATLELNYRGSFGLGVHYSTVRIERLTPKGFWIRPSEIRKPRWFTFKTHQWVSSREEALECLKVRTDMRYHKEAQRMAIARYNWQFLFPEKKLPPMPWEDPEED